MAKTKAELVSMIENELVDSTSNKITGDRVKDVLKDIVDAMGEGGGGTGGGGAMEYWRVPEGLSSTSEEYYIMAMFAMLVRADLTTLGEAQICSGMLAITGVSDYITAFAFDPTAKVTMQGVLMSIRDLLAELGGDLSEAGFTKITEDEFYAIN